MKALGIVAMILAIVSIFVPVVGPYLTLICALLAAFAAGEGLTFAIVAIVLNILNVVLLSPSLMVVAGAAEIESVGLGSQLLAGMAVVFIGAQVVAAIILTIVHMMWKKKQANKKLAAV